MEGRGENKSEGGARVDRLFFVGRMNCMCENKASCVGSKEDFSSRVMVHHGKNQVLIKCIESDTHNDCFKGN